MKSDFQKYKEQAPQVGEELQEKMKNFVYRPIFIKFGTKQFLGLLKPNLKSDLQKSEKQAPTWGGELQKKIFKKF